MHPLDDYPLAHERNGSAPLLRREETWRLSAVAGIAFSFVAAIIAFFLVRPSDPTRPAVDGAAPAATVREPAASTRPLGAVAAPRELPPIDLADPVVRELLSGLSARPELAAWLATDGLVRNLVAGVDGVASGIVSASHARPLAPSRPFAVESRGGALVIDPRSYTRYNGIAHTVGSLDAAALVRAYTTLRPRLDEAYRELGYPDGRFDAAVERALARLLSTPTVPEDAAVYPSPVLYKFTDERIERLSPAEKQLLRMGPRNAKIIQDKLHEVAVALGISGASLSNPPRGSARLAK